MKPSRSPAALWEPRPLDRSPEKKNRVPVCIPTPWRLSRVTSQVSGVHQSPPVTGPNRNRMDTYGVHEVSPICPYWCVHPPEWDTGYQNDGAAIQSLGRHVRLWRAGAALGLEWSASYSSGQFIIASCPRLAAPFNQCTDICAHCGPWSSGTKRDKGPALASTERQGSNIGIAKRPLLAVKSPSCPLFLVVSLHSSFLGLSPLPLSRARFLMLQFNSPIGGTFCTFFPRAQPQCPGFGRLPPSHLLAQLILLIKGQDESMRGISRHVRPPLSLHLGSPSPWPPSLLGHLVPDFSFSLQS
ncbi:uncharacterized protein LY79DRAFT_103367 [Colletotrichum navitas]|uniref:Uncharacterized protein n=1 Tax=Colletotrichum navitas TaxID=681940 RepID=A0AAD8Q5J9_9PEZI|nr:uncharacterized protein LY79DRAFT_103367 [Colletotrichum navitas]KAK1595646.1 hypothetical protein LY79DRAFT_103367 [Colletotrichum navitas]